MSQNYSPMEEGTDQEKLLDFAVWLPSLFFELVNNHRYLWLFESRTSLQEVWSESAPHLRLLVAEVKALSSDRMEECGLEGHHLRLQLDLIAFWWNRFN